MNPPPLGIMSFLLKAAPSGSSLLGRVQRAGVDDVATLPCPEGSIYQLLIFSAPPPVCAGEWLTTSHNNLQGQQSLKFNSGCFLKFLKTEMN